MNDQPLDLRRSMQLLRRHKIIVAAFRCAGPRRGPRAGHAEQADADEQCARRAPVFRARHLHPGAHREQRPVLAGAARTIDSRESPAELRTTIQVKSSTSNIISISAQGKTAAQAEHTANAVAQSYVAYVDSPSRPGPSVQARILQPALNASGPTTFRRLLVNGLLGAVDRAADRHHRGACHPSQGPALAGARRDSRCHRDPRPDIDPGRSSLRRPGLEEALRGLSARSRRCVAPAQDAAPAVALRRGPWRPQAGWRFLARGALAVFRPQGPRPRPPAGSLRRLPGNPHDARRRARSRTRTPRPCCVLRAQRHWNLRSDQGIYGSQ